MLSHRQLFLRHLAQTSEAPLMLEIEKAEGVFLFDTQGKSYLDLISGIAVSNVGHRHPKVLKAIHHQLDHYMHLMVYGEYVQSPQVKLAEKIASLLPQPLESVYLVNSGAEAIEGALKLSKRYTGRTEIISCKRSYHGSTHGALSIMGDEYFKNRFRPLLPDTRLIEYNNLNELEVISRRTAAVVIESVQGESGYIPAQAEWIQTLADTCKSVGALLILDEIQTGFGRTGKMFGFEHYGITPDIITFAKGMGGGMPIGAFVSSREIMSSLSKDPVLGHITTFGGNAVCAAAALATITAIEEENLVKEIDKKSQMIQSFHHPSILRKQGLGLMYAYEFTSFPFLTDLIRKCLEKGLITDWFLFQDKAMRICPPLTITEEELQRALQLLREALDD